jgi:hypothetical protein
VTSFPKDGICTVGPLPRWLRPSVAGVSCNVVACVPLCNILLLHLHHLAVNRGDRVERARLYKAPNERCFGVQIATNNIAEGVKAAKLARAAGGRMHRGGIRGGMPSAKHTVTVHDVTTPPPASDRGVVAPACPQLHTLIAATWLDLGFLNQHSRHQTNTAECVACRLQVLPGSTSTAVARYMVSFNEQNRMGLALFLVGAFASLHPFIPFCIGDQAGPGRRLQRKPTSLHSGQVLNHHTVRGASRLREALASYHRISSICRGNQAWSGCCTAAQAYKAGKDGGRHCCPP